MKYKQDICISSRPCNVHPHQSPIPLSHSPVFVSWLFGSLRLLAIYSIPGILTRYSCHIMVLLSTLYGHLEAYAGLLQSCSLKQLDFFIRLCRHFRSEIDLHSPVTSLEPPHRLPLYLNTFLSETLYLDSTVVLHLWDALKGFIWLYDVNYEMPQISEAETSLIDSAGAKTIHKQDKLGWLYSFSVCFFISFG